MQPGVIGKAFRALVAHKAGKDQQFCVNIPHTQLGQIISELARENTGTVSPESIWVIIAQFDRSASLNLKGDKFKKGLDKTSYLKMRV